MIFARCCNSIYFQFARMQRGMWNRREWSKRRWKNRWSKGLAPFIRLNFISEICASSIAYLEDVVFVLLPGARCFALQFFVV